MSAHLNLTASGLCWESVPYAAIVVQVSSLPASLALSIEQEVLVGILIGPPTNKLPAIWTSPLRFATKLPLCPISIPSFDNNKCLEASVPLAPPSNNSNVVLVILICSVDVGPIVVVEP